MNLVLPSRTIGIAVGLCLAAIGASNAQVTQESVDAERLVVRSARLVDVGVRNPRWSKRGDRLVYTKVQPEGVWLAELPSLRRSLVAPQTLDAAWALDGNKLVVLRRDPQARVFRLLVHDLTTKQVVDVMSMPSEMYRLSWRADALYTVRSYSLEMGRIDLGNLTIQSVVVGPQSLQEADQQEFMIRSLADYNLQHPAVDFGVDLNPTQPLSAHYPKWGGMSWHTQSLRVLLQSVYGHPFSQRREGWIGFWVRSKDLSRARLLVSGVQQAEVSPDYRLVAFVRGDSLYVANIEQQPTSPPLMWTIRGFKTADLGLVPGDLLWIHNPKRNPLNNSVIGYAEPKATALVHTVWSDSLTVLLHEIAQIPDSGDMAFYTPDFYLGLVPNKSRLILPVEPLYSFLNPLVTTREALKCMRLSLTMRPDWVRRLSEPFWTLSCGPDYNVFWEFVGRARLKEALPKVIEWLAGPGDPGNKFEALWAAAQLGDRRAEEVVRGVCQGIEQRWGGPNSRPRESRLCVRTLAALSAKVSDELRGERTNTPNHPMPGAKVLEDYATRDSTHPAFAGYHAGIDFEGAGHVAAAAKGKVALLIHMNSAGAGGGLGNTIILEHKTIAGETLYTLYGNVADVRPDLAVGMEVAKGSVLGRTSASAWGRDTHWIRPRGKGRCLPAHVVVNPSQYAPCERLHFQVKARPVLENPEPESRCSNPSLIATTVHPDQCGYRNPWDVIQGRVQFVST